MDKRNKKDLAEFKYDLERETDVEKIHELITNYMYSYIPAEGFAAHELKELKKLNEKRISSLKDVLDVQCSSGNWDHDPYMHGMANGMILIQSIMTDTKPEFLNPPKDGFLKDKNITEKVCKESKSYGIAPLAEIEEELNKVCEGKKSITLNVLKHPTHTDLLKKWVKINEDKIARLEQKDDYNERNREALNELYGEGRYGDEYDDQGVWGKECDEDIDYFRNKIISGLKIPKEFIGFGTGSDENAHDKTYTIEAKNYPQEELQKLAEDTIKRIKSPGIPVRENTTEIGGIPHARKILRDAFAADPDFKQSYMANIAMFLLDHADVLIDEQIIYDLIDYILAE